MIETRCIDCGTHMCSTRGGQRIRQRCDSCRRVHIRKYKTRWAAAHYTPALLQSATCADCTVAFEAASRSGPMPKRCEDCARKRDRERVEAWTAAHQARTYIMKRRSKRRSAA